MKRVIIRVSGKVQGVFYRASAKDEADRFGIRGIIRNEPDGSVLIDAEGDEAVLNEFIAWCKKGPRRANVLSATVEHKASIGYPDFQIRR